MQNLTKLIQEKRTKNFKYLYDGKFSIVAASSWKVNLDLLRIPENAITLREFVGARV